ncbi:MAG TPA: hypothetical protein DD417_11875 [Elusimicrobia bacterium]|nr:hypothetical protein [Elusimicrobiota bacterium]
MRDNELNEQLKELVKGDMLLVFSVDGTETAVYEAIRRGARFADLLRRESSTTGAAPTRTGWTWSSSSRVQRLSRTQTRDWAPSHPASVVNG